MRRLLLPVLVLAVLALLAGTAPEGPGCHAAQEEGACAGCHKDDARARWEASRYRPCTAWCLTCHAKGEMDRHHTVGTVLRKDPGPAYPVTKDRRMTCATCHDLSRQRFDAVRWKASSLYDRLFRGEARYPTYFLAQRNDQGQLCLACH